MKRTIGLRLVLPALALALLLVLAWPAAAEEDLIAQIRNKFWWWTPEVAIASGFTTDGRCIERPGVGAMGIHYTKGAHVDSVFNALEPEALVFDPFTQKVVAVEYISTAKETPAAFGERFDPFPPIPGAWALHLWLIENPLGRFSPWNSLVRCTLDPSKETVLIGVAMLPDLNVRLELEPAKPMTMLMAGRWTEMKPMASERYHIEVKAGDPKSRTRLSYARVTFEGVNQDTGRRLRAELHPMWGSSGLHYASNGDLPDGTYRATVTVGVPTFARGPGDEARWMVPTQAHFAFTLRDGLVVSARVAEGGEVAAPAAPAAPAPPPAAPHEHS